MTATWHGLMLSLFSAAALLLMTAPGPAYAQTPDDIDRALQADQADQNLGQLDPTKEPLDWITGLEVRPDGVTEVPETPSQKKKKEKN